MAIAASSAAAGAASEKTHVCAPDEGKAACPVGRARFCGNGGAFAACACPPGSTAPKSGKGACVIDPKPVVVACAAPNASLGAQMAAHLAFGALEMPPLDTIAKTGAVSALAAVDGKEKTASADALFAAAESADELEGAAAAVGGSKSGAAQKAAFAERDRAVARGIEVRRAFVARFSSDPRVDDVRLGLARALLRRAAYAGVAPSVAADRKQASALLRAIVDGGSSTRATRDAQFMLLEQAVRDRDWIEAIARAEAVLARSATKAWADDHALVAAASARIAQARLETGDLARAKDALVAAIEAGLVCAPRTECVSAASGARRVLGETWAATSSPARTMHAVLAKGSMPRHERVRPLIVLAERYAEATGDGCAAAAEEARAWEQLL